MASQKSSKAGKKRPDKPSEDGPKVKEPRTTEEDMICYIHGVSPLKQSFTGTNYFNCVVQSKIGARKAVSFSPKKRKLFTEVQSAKSPVKIGRADLRRGDLIISDKTTVKLVAQDDVDFKHNEKLSKFAAISLADAEELASGQLTNVKSEVASISEVSTHKTKNGENLSKQEVIIRDDTTYRKLVLFGGDVGKLEVIKTYILKNLRLHRYRNVAYFNTCLGA